MLHPRRCTWHRRTRGNRNAHRHGRYSAQARGIRALSRLQNRVADLAKAQLAVMNARAHGDVHRVEIAEKQVSTRLQRKARAVLALDRVLLETGDQDAHRLVEGALRLTDLV